MYLLYFVLLETELLLFILVLIALLILHAFVLLRCFYIPMYLYLNFAFDYFFLLFVSEKNLYYFMFSFHGSYRTHCDCGVDCPTVLICDREMMYEL